MLQAFGLSYEPDPRVGLIFENLSLSILPGERVALTGRNGVGKTKLLEILAGLLEPTRGTVVRTGTIGYLPQEFELDFDGSLDDLLGDTPALRRLFPRLGVTRSMLDQSYYSLSLGERTRAHLALALKDDPDILLLDEPTNHLDVQGRQWLENTLSGGRQGVLMVTHDRATIDALADRVLELDRGQLKEFAGGYTAMQRTKQQERERQQETFLRQNEEAKRLLASAEETLKKAKQIAKPPSKGTYDPKHSPFYIAKAGRVDKRAQAIRKRVEQARAYNVEKPFEDKSTELVFPAKPLRSDYPLIVRGLSKAYSKPVLVNLNLTLERRARIGVVGPNGAGKTTLFRILLQEDKPDAGQLTWSADVDVAYLSQDRRRLPGNFTVLEAIGPQGHEDETFVRTLLARLNMRREDVNTAVNCLSVGERTKAEIVSMLTSPANVLLLDEPTNHLDIPSLEALEEALIAFPGSVIFTSHDRAFVDRVATEVLAL